MSPLPMIAGITVNPNGAEPWNRPKFRPNPVTTTAPT